jgi:hypothetical protein
VTASILCAFLALAAAPVDDAGPTVYTPQAAFEAAVRGQSPFYGPETAPPDYAAPTTTAPLGGSPWPVQPIQFGPPPGYGQDPFLDAPPANPYYGAAPGGDPWWLREGGTQISGLNGPQPYRFGWSSRLDASYIPGQEVSNGEGEFQIVEVDIAARNAQPVAPGLVFTHGPEVGWRSWEGPNNVSGFSLPEDVFHLGWDFELATTAGPAWGFIAGLTPSFNSDFENTGSDAWQIDARFAAVHQAGPDLQYIFGVQYWDRVDHIFLPWIGIVYTPTDRLEYRIMFPESRISYYVGNLYGDDKWIYAALGYQAEAYAVQLTTPLDATRDDQIQLTDWRAVVGLRSDGPLFGSFIEAGVIFGRDVEFERTRGFDVDSGFILRGGLRY